MNDKFFGTIKLVTGEEIVGLVEVHEQGLLIKDPLVLEDMSHLHELFDDVKISGLKLSKWIKSTTDNIFFITDAKIVTVNELIEPGLTHYKRAVVQINETTKEELASRKKLQSKKKYNGYRASVDDARSFFENLFDSY